MQPRAGSVRPKGRRRGSLPGRRTLPALAAAGALALLAAAPAGADWLVTRDGERIETKGEWQVKRALVVFHLPSGELASLKLADVDLEASREATAAAARPASAAAPAPKEAAKPVLVLTDADVAHVRPATASEASAEEAAESDEDSGEPGEEGEAAEAAPERLVVTGWGEVDDPQVAGVTITGQVRNASADVTASTTVTVKLYDADGEILASAQARLTASTLTPGQTANFRAAFPSIFTYETVRFETDSVPLKSATESAAESAADQ